MCPSGLQTTLEISCRCKALQHPVVGDRMLAADHTAFHALPVLRITPERCVHSSFLFLHPALCQCEITARNAVRLQLFGNALMRPVIFAGNHHTCRVPIDAVYNSRPKNPVDARQAVFTVVQEGIDQCSAGMPGCRVNHHTLGLVDYDDILVFIKNVERNIFRKHLCRLGFRQSDRKAFPRCQWIARLARLAVDQDAPLLNQLLSMCACQLRKEQGDRYVQSLIRKFFLNNELLQTCLLLF